MFEKLFGWALSMYRRTGICFPNVKAQGRSVLEPGRVVLEDDRVRQSLRKG